MQKQLFSAFGYSSETHQRWLPRCGGGLALLRFACGGRNDHQPSLVILCQWHSTIKTTNNCTMSFWLLFNSFLSII